MSRDTAEHQRLLDHRQWRADWRKWGPYVAERAWGTVREDYSPDGDAWRYFPHEHARSRAYRWNEDGLGAFCNRYQSTCLGLALWNEKDPILKERLFGLSGKEGNHGEDVKEYYYYLDALPSHAYQRMLYKYPLAAYPYQELLEANEGRSRDLGEIELIDLLERDFAAGRYFDVFIVWAKADPEDLLCEITVCNRSKEDAPIHVLPHIWHRNTWSWGDDATRPLIERNSEHSCRTEHPQLGERWWYVDAEGDLLFTDNDTNAELLWGTPSTGWFKDAFHHAVIGGERSVLRKDDRGTKCALHHRAIVAAGGRHVVRVRYRAQPSAAPFDDFDRVIRERSRDCDAFYRSVHPAGIDDEQAQVQRQAFAGMLWTKQFYHYNVELWLRGDPNQPKPPASRLHGRNAGWEHVFNNDILSVPDTWEYPWYASWDTAFHAVALALVDPDFAKRQLLLLLREWYMHPNGALPAYEWSLDDVNPPVHAWSAWQVYKISRRLEGRADTDFLEKVFQKLLLNFTWWVNRKDSRGRNVFQGGFLGLDNIGPFNRSELPMGGDIEQADGTAWMAMYCVNMLAIALELARTRPPYEDIATKFFEHFVYIANAFYDMGRSGASLWHEEDGFYYDVLHTPDGRYVPVRVRSSVGLIPLFAVGGLPPRVLEELPHFRRRVDWFLRYRPHLVERIGSLQRTGKSGFFQVSIANRERLERMLDRLFDPNEFLSDYGLRSLSKHHLDHPYELRIAGRTWRVQYEPAESRSGLFGGNSNWRGPIWFPINYLMIQALRKYHLNYGDDFRVEVPKGSGRFMNLAQAAEELRKRLIRIFLEDGNGTRPFRGDRAVFHQNPLFREHLLFHEYFHGDTGRGLGASHQTGWTGLVARLIAGHDEVGMGV